MYKQFVAWICNGCSTAPLTDYINNPVYQELIDEDKYFEAKNDERIYLDLRASSGYTKKAEKLFIFFFIFFFYNFFFLTKNFTLTH